MTRSILAGFVGFSEGIVVGSALIAFLTLLDIVPRLAQLTNTENHIKIYEMMIVFSSTVVSILSFSQRNVTMGSFFVIGIGLLTGMYIGLLAAALAEVTNVIPVIVNRFKLHNYIKYIFFALASGKVVGSLIYWLIINE